MFSIVFNASESQKPLRVTLKSRKVYIGVVESEQLENADFENITLIPYLSGHRDRDTLRMVIDHNYQSVYDKRGIIQNHDFSKLSEFKIVIRLDEVESLSLFDIDNYSDFQDG